MVLTKVDSLALFVKPVMSILRLKSQDMDKTRAVAAGMQRWLKALKRYVGDDTDDSEGAAFQTKLMEASYVQRAFADHGSEHARRDGPQRRMEEVALRHVGDEAALVLPVVP